MKPLPIKNHYQEKDMEKAKICNKFIGIGAKGSSTEYYAENFPQEVVNCGKYAKEDMVFVSMNGGRPGRIGITHPVLLKEILAAIHAGVSFVCDNQFHRNRDFNVGERELAGLLEEWDYLEYPNLNYSIWRKP